MLDESMFEDIHEIAENSAYLKAVEEKDVSRHNRRQQTITTSSHTRVLEHARNPFSKVC